MLKLSYIYNSGLEIYVMFFFQADIKEQVYNTLLFFVGLEDEDFVSHTLKALGSVCVRHYEFMLRPELKEFYHQLLTSDLAPIDMKADVLRNVEMYLQEEEQRMIRQDKECKVFGTSVQFGIFA